MRAKILSYGCSNNLHEAEVAAGLLTEAGFEIADKDNNADLFIVNMCSVKNPTENKIMKKIAELASEKRKVIVTGCVPKHALAALKRLKSVSIVDTHNIDKIAEIAQKAAKGKTEFLMGQTRRSKINLPKKRASRIISIIPICSGCKGSCSYCSVKAIKGELFSYPLKSIVREAETSLKQGCREIWITSQDNAAYQYSEKGKKHFLPELLKEILSLPYDFKLRLGMMNPNNVEDIADYLIKVYKHPKMFKFLHMPAQAGSDRILKLMNRHYTVHDFMKIVKKFRQAIPAITVSTDVICGFPGETGKEFNETLDLVKILKPAVLNISRYWPRPGTAALRLPGQLHGKVTKLRSQELTKVFKAMAVKENRRWIGWKGKAMIDEFGKDNTLVARNDFYRPIILKCNKTCKSKLGDIVEVKVKSVTAHDLRS